MADRATQIKELKQQERAKHTWEERHVMALEEMADTLEAIRSDIRGITNTLPMVLQKK